MDSQCGFDGNSNIYGLVVRVGIYLQWLTSMISETLVLQAVESTREANATYQIAMLAGLVQITITDSDTIAIEGYITLLFYFAST